MTFIFVPPRYALWDPVQTGFTEWSNGWGRFRHGGPDGMEIAGRLAAASAVRSARDPITLLAVDVNM
jgi:hypothetical protein